MWRKDKMQMETSRSSCITYEYIITLKDGGGGCWWDRAHLRMLVIKF